MAFVSHRAVASSPNIWPSFCVHEPERYVLAMAYRHTSMGCCFWGFSDSCKLAASWSLVVTVELELELNR